MEASSTCFGHLDETRLAQAAQVGLAVDGAIPATAAKARAVCASPSISCSSMAARAGSPMAWATDAMSGSAGIASA
ncbi:hypothetical protein [Amycolatopsis sp. NPDC021455]|uniref:hypothetical protein n=1 Tax=Amycolatopsis sp. NPDC021455 TaxID=3154901 RepID=UPI0033FE115A